jgi:hypothetical protein
VAQRLVSVTTRPAMRWGWWGPTAEASSQRWRWEGQVQGRWSNAYRVDRCGRPGGESVRSAREKGGLLSGETG